MTNKLKIQYRLEKQKKVTKSISHSKKIYLDLNYWIRIRDAYFEKSNDPELKKLCSILIKLVESKKYICPVSPVVFFETLKQSGMSCFNQTIKIIELLSENITTVTEEEIIFSQFKSFFLPFIKQEVPIDHEELIWTKVIDTFGRLIPNNSLGISENIELYKRRLDKTWDISLSELFNDSNIEKEKLNFDFKNIEAISRLNKKNFEHSTEFSSFDNLLNIERRGVLETYKIIAWKAFEATLEDCEKNYSKETKLKIFFTLMKKSIEPSSKIPSLIEIPAGIHSLIRYENRKYYDFNDIFDFHHSFTAVSFFDFFFTEKKLSNLLNHRRLDYGNTYNCIIEHNLSKINNILENLN